MRYSLRLQSPWKLSLSSRLHRMQDQKQLLESWRPISFKVNSSKYLLHSAVKTWNQAHIGWVYLVFFEHYQTIHYHLRHIFGIEMKNMIWEVSPCLSKFDESLRSAQWATVCPKLALWYLFQFLNKYWMNIKYIFVQNMAQCGVSLLHEWESLNTVEPWYYPCIGY